MSQSKFCEAAKNAESSGWVFTAERPLRGSGTKLPGTARRPRIGDVSDIVSALLNFVGRGAGRQFLLRVRRSRYWSVPSSSLASSAS